MGSIYLFEKSILDNARKNLKEGEKITIRRQQCAKYITPDMQCGMVLALQIGDNLDEQRQSEYYVVNGGIEMSGELMLTYKKERWFGNHVRCPACGNEGKLPMDKPLNWDLMSRSREIVKQGGTNA